MPALVPKQYHPLIAAFRERLKAKGLNGKAVVCAAMRKLIHIAISLAASSNPGVPSILISPLHEGTQDGIYLTWE
jgi:hypothetical protein